MAGPQRGPHDLQPVRFGGQQVLAMRVPLGASSAAFPGGAVVAPDML